MKRDHFDFTPLHCATLRGIKEERFVALNVTFNVILSAMRSGATNEVEVSL